ncbi:putative metalloprotease, partial [Mycena olivaceomarginata]
FTNNLFPLAPLADGSVPTGDFYRPRSGKKPLVPKYGNSLSVLLVLNAMKMQPCRPGFFEVRDAIIVMDQELTGGENFCTLWRGFSFKVLGPDANIALRTLWDGGVRTD